MSASVTDHVGKDDRVEVPAAGFGGGLVAGIGLTAVQYVEAAGATAAVIVAEFTRVIGWGIGDIVVIA